MTPKAARHRATIVGSALAVAVSVIASSVLAACSSADDPTGAPPPSLATTATTATPNTTEPWAGDPDATAGIDDVSATTIEAPTDDLLDDDARAEAEELRQAVAAAAAEEPWGDLAGARTHGYLPMAGDPLHWYDPEAVADDVLVDPRRPEFLMFSGDELQGVMFLAPSDDGTTAPPRAPGSPLVRWHLHRWSVPICLGEGGLVAVAVARNDEADGGGRCGPGEVAASNSPWMFHVWLVGDDPFSAEMHVEGHSHH